MGLRDKLTKKLGREPTASELAEARAKRDAKRAAATEAEPAAVPEASTAGESNPAKKSKKAAAAETPPAAASAPSAEADKGKRAPSAYNLFMKAEVAKVKAANPGMAHKDAFALAASHSRGGPP